MEKILLVRPNFKIRRIYPPLGLAYIAGWLRRQNSKYRIKIVDGLVKNLRYEDFKELFLEFKPHVLGITSMDICSEQTHEIAKIAKTVDKNCSVIVGGPYPTSDPETVTTDRNIDFAVIGEGEKAIENLIKIKIAGVKPAYIKGIGYRRNGKFILNSPPEYISDINKLPFPAWDLVELQKYSNFKDVPIPVLTTRGCPYNCIYCLDIFGKKIRFRSVENILQELELLVNRYEVNHIAITDDIFNINKERTLKLCNTIINNNLNIRIFIGYGLKIEYMDGEIVKKLKEAGTYWITYGIEPLSKRIQHLMKRDFDSMHARDIINFTVKQGMVTEGMVGIGAPGETKEEIMKTIRYVKSTKLHRANFLPISSFFPKIKMKKLFREGNLSNSTSESNNVNFPSGKQLKRIKRKAYIGFYLNPLRIWHLLLTIGHKLKLFR